MVETERAIKRQICLLIGPLPSETLPRAIKRQICPSDRSTTIKDTSSLFPRTVLASGSITLFQVVARASVLAVACTRCDRAGRYGMDTLIARHGPDFSIPELLRLLSAGCPKRASVSAYDLCGIHCPDLSSLFTVRRA